MPRPDFPGFREELQAAGVSRSVICRMVEELEDHFEDLVSAHRRRGLAVDESMRMAVEELGDLAGVREFTASRPELLGFMARHPLFAGCAAPVLAAGNYLRSVDVDPLAEHAARWMTGAVISGLVTAAMFLSLQLAIALS